MREMACLGTNANRPLNAGGDGGQCEVGRETQGVVECFGGRVAIASLWALTYDGQGRCIPVEIAWNAWVTRTQETVVVVAQMTMVRFVVDVDLMGDTYFDDVGLYREQWLMREQA